MKDFKEELEEFIQIQWTASSLEEARAILETLLVEKLICCGSIIPFAESWYVWEGEVVTEQEMKVVMKTMAHLFKKVEKVIKNNHTYEIPEILVFTIKNGSDSYLQWMRDQVLS